MTQPRVVAGTAPSLGQRAVRSIQGAIAAIEVGAVLLGLAIVVPIPPAAAVVLAAAYVVLAVRQDRPLPFRLEQLVTPSMLVFTGAVTNVVALLAGGSAADAVVAGVVAVALQVVSKVAVGGSIRRLRRTGRLADRACLVGNHVELLALAECCGQMPHFGLIPTSRMSLSTIAALADGATEPPAGEGTLIVAHGLDLDRATLGHLRWAVARGYQVLLELPRQHRHEEVTAIGQVIDLGPTRLVTLPAPPMSHRSWVIKRAFDVVSATAALVALSPVMLAAAIGVKLTSPGPVLFRQTRISRNGQPFTMLKFRSFPVDHVDDEFSLDHGRCPLPFGRFLRRTSIDELPQLFNVLRGEMSVVGPRPERTHFVEELAETIAGYEERHRVPGGITGLAQVNGFWGNSDLRGRIRLDNDYIDRWRLGTDLRVLLRTPMAMVRKSRPTTTEDVVPEAVRVEVAS